MNEQIFLKKLSMILITASMIFAIPLSGQEKKSGYRPQTRRQVKYNKEFHGQIVMQNSENKVVFIRDVVKSYVDNKDDITNQTIINQIYDLIEKEFVIQPKAKPDNRTIQELRKEALRQIKKVYPKEEAEYRAELQKKAEKLYTNYKVGDKVVLTYVKGRSRYRVKDIFYRFNGNTVSIGLRTIPFVDLIEEDKIKVSPAYAQRRRDEYVKKELTEYLTKRRDALLSKETELERKQFSDNIKNGFVLYAAMWRYPIQVINIRLIENIESNPRYAGKVKGLNLDSIQRIQIKYIGDPIDKKELNARVESLRENAAKMAGSIDTEQGFYSTAFWGFTKEEVKIVIEAQGLNFIPGKEYDRAVVSDRQVLENRLYYEKGRLAKVVTVYDIDNFDAFLRVRKNMLDKYGPDDRSKQKEFVRPGDPLTWTGIITDGYLYVKQNPTTGEIEDKISFTLKRVPLAEQQKRGELLKKRK